ncbi:MAG: hypothetical protein GXO79_07925 [Chlorobi bacterium]|nr:hypothetical protein [Chlorobiota bacterium]
MKINTSNILQIIISGLFIFIILFTFLNQSFFFVGNQISNENRKLAEKPTLNFKNINSFPAKYESYYNDHFSLKKYYVSFMSFLSIKIYKKAALKWKVIRGQDDWLFEMKKDLPLFLGEKTFTQNQLNKLKVEFTKRLEYFKKRDIKMYILICPSKYSVYPEKLPFFLKQGRS